MAQGYFEIRFRKEDGSNDGDMLENVIEWCKNQYDWFNEGIDEGQINVESALESVNNNGLVESEVPGDALETDWITEIFEEFHPVDMKAVQILGDGEYSEGPYSYRKWITTEKGTLRCRDGAWDWTDGAAVASESGPNGPLLEQSETLGKYFAKFTNKKNGKTARVYISISDDELIFDWDAYLLDENDDRISCLDCFDHFGDGLIDAIKNNNSGLEDTEDDNNEENWEFNGFMTDDFWNAGEM